MRLRRESHEICEIELLIKNYRLTGYFYNPNIYPLEEYAKRLDAAREVAARYEIPFIEGGYEPEIFIDAIRGLEHEPENGQRCLACYRLRLSKTAETAAHDSFDFIASTLTLGPHKKASIINPIGREAAAKNGIVFIEGDWKKMNGFKHSCELSREYGIYRQNYCGCLFSLNNSAQSHNF